MKYPVHIIHEEASMDILSDFLEKLDININGFGHQRGSSSDFRISTDFEIIYCTGGRCEIYIEETRYMGEQGDLFFIPPYTKNRIHTVADCPSQNFWVHFDIHALYFTERFATALMGKTGVHHLHLGDLPWAITLYEIMEQETMQEKLGFQQARLALFHLVLIELVRARVAAMQCEFSMEVIADRQNQIIVQADAYIRAQLQHKIAVADIAKSLAISEPYLFKIFSDVLHLSPTVYVNLLRAKAAKVAIQTTDLSFQEIAENLGFQSYYYFSCFFKKRYGMSPKEFKERMRT